MEKFWGLLEESVLVQGTIALLLTITIIALYLHRGDAPESLINLLMVIIGYYFGSKSQQIIYRSRNHK